MKLKTTISSLIIIGCNLVHADVAYLTMLPLVTGDPGVINVIDTSIDTVIATITVGVNPFSLIASPNGRYVYVPNANSGTINVIDTLSNTIVATITTGPAGGSSPLYLAITPDNNKLYATTNTGYVSVINTATNTITGTIPTGPTPINIVMSPNGTRAYVTNYATNPSGAPGDLTVINTANDTIIATIAVGTRPEQLTISPDGSKVYVQNYFSDNITAINTANNTVIATITVGSEPYQCIFSSDSSTAYVQNRASNNVSVINTNTSNVTQTITVGTTPFGLTLSVDGKKLYVSNEASLNVSIINTANDTITATLPVTNNSPQMFSPYPLFPIATPSGDKIYVAVYDSTVNVISTATNTITAVIPTSRLYDNFMIIIPATAPAFNIQPPQNLTGNQRKDKFGTETSFVNSLYWNAPSNTDISSPSIFQYNIYRNAALTDLAGIVPATSSSLEFQDPARRKNTPYTYYVVSVATFPILTISTPATITINP